MVVVEVAPGAVGSGDAGWVVAEVVVDRGGAVVVDDDVDEGTIGRPGACCA
ncbi:MAG: hypothetical protein QOI47_22 [Actinomycetota bacterium]|nr:hypothetical protein [Actinomycetota bacterium]